MSGPITIIGAIQSNSGYFRTAEAGRICFGRLSLKRSHPSGLPLRLEHGRCTEIGEVYRLERHEQTGVIWAVAGVWPEPARMIDWSVPRFFSPGGTGTVTARRTEPGGSYDDYDLSMELDELSVVEDAAQSLTAIRRCHGYDISEKISPGGWPSDMPWHLQGVLDRCWTETHTSGYWHRRSLDIVDIPKPQPPAPPRSLFDTPPTVGRKRRTAEQVVADVQRRRAEAGQVPAEPTVARRRAETVDTSLPKEFANLPGPAHRRTWVDGHLVASP